MNLKRKCRVVTLLIQKDKQLSLKSDRDYLVYKEDNIFNPFTNQYYALYLLSDEEIKEDDWFIKFRSINNKPNLYQESKKAFMNSEWLNSSDINDCFKVIASTDKSLNLPEPSPQFIQKYIEEWNKGNKITEVMVDYEEYFEENTSKPYIQGIGQPAIKIHQLRVDKNNYITITKAKDSWSKEEVKQLCWQAFIDHKCINGKIKPSNASNLLDPFNKWIEENL